MKIRVKKECPSIPLPSQGHKSDAGWDLYSNEEAYIPPRSHRMIDTGIRLEIPEGYVGLVWPRSGLAVKDGVDIFAGVIDSGYRGVVKVCLYNSSSKDIEIKRNDRIAQILFQQVPSFELEEIQDLSSSEREEGGFGSTGR